MNNSKNTMSTGCQFTLFPMTDDFVTVILSTLDEVDTTNVSMQTDDVSTSIKGSTVQLFDITKAMFIRAASTGFHVAMSGTFSVGCAGINDENIHTAQEGDRLNKENIQHLSQDAACKIALYPIGSNDYTSIITEQLEVTKREKVKVSSDHYATRLDGDAKDIFEMMEALFTNVEKEVPRLSLTFTISANSPSTKKGDVND